MSEHINKTSVCSSFNDGSDHRPILRMDWLIKFFETSNDIGKEINAIVPSNLKGPSFHCPQYIKNLSHEKHIAYKNFKPLTDCSDIDTNIASIGKHFIEKNFKLGWKGLKKLAKPYLASDVSGHSLNRDYWERIFRFNNRNSDTWDINQPITTEEIKNTILSMKNIKAPGPDVKFGMVLFPKKWNSASIVSIPKKGDLSDCNNYRGISLINDFNLYLHHQLPELDCSSRSHVPYMEGLAAFLTKTIPIIRHRYLTLVPYTGSDVRNSLNDNINDLIGEFSGRDDTRTVPLQSSLDFFAM
ncbi:hypothetical protein PIROE2DRAFT_1769 [Piromyces sp. E2]|nr:hypothetical protein PIROE2DRAFT_1769 [Piromyces sp. E2]|eukprot:OUM70091.1 hypothetical protein PIROE2DRAFT_1769 [Piromyces sp. E2]